MHGLPQETLHLEDETIVFDSERNASFGFHLHDPPTVGEDHEAALALYVELMATVCFHRGGNTWRRCVSTVVGLVSISAAISS